MSETTIEKTERGPQVAIQCVYLINGVALAYWVRLLKRQGPKLLIVSQVDFGFTRMDNQISWRFPIALQSLFTTCSFIGMLILPDTPRWYYSKGRNDEGDRVLSRLHDQPIESELVQQQRQEILETVKLEKVQGRLNLSDLFWDRSERQIARRIRTSFLLLSLQQNMG